MPPKPHIGIKDKVHKAGQMRSSSSISSNSGLGVRAGVVKPSVKKEEIKEKDIDVALDDIEINFSDLEANDASIKPTELVVKLETYSTPTKKKPPSYELTEQEKEDKKLEDMVMME